MISKLTRLFLLTLIVPLVLPSSASAQGPGSDNPRRRWEYFYNQRAYPFDRIPPGALQRARAQLRNRLFLQAVPPPIAGTQWNSIGPEGIPINIRSIGRLTAIAVHPTNSNIIYIGGAQGGVWKTTDGGAFWTPMTDGECSLAMGDLAIDPINPEIVYAGTGEQHFSGDSYYGCGLLRSTDGGASWTHLGASVFQTDSGGARISRVVIDPSTAGATATTTVLVASTFGLFRSVDGGTNWTEILSGTVTDLVVDPSDSGIWYAAVWGGGVFKSTDSTATWTQLTDGFPSSQVGRINLAIAPSSPATLYAAIHNSQTSELLGIWKTVDGGSNWAQLSASNASCRTQCWYDLAIAVHPTNPDLVYFGGVSLYASFDGGTSFINIRGLIHVDQHAIVFDPQDPDVVFIGNDGGIFRSTDGGITWASLNTNLARTQFYAGISLHPTDALIAMGGTQDNGTLQYSGSPGWLHVLGGDGGYTAIDFTDPSIRYAETQWSTNSTFSGPRRSDGGGFVSKNNGIDVSDQALFIPPLVMDPANPHTLYFGTFRLYRTTDRAETWTPISDNLSRGNGRISAIAPAFADAAVVYVGTSDGAIQITTDGGTTWNSIEGALPRRFVTDVAVDPLDWRTAYVTFSGFNSGHVFRTTDAGATWQNATSNLPDLPVNAIVLDPAARETAIVGTDLGVFMTGDSGTTWTVLSNGFPSVAVFDIAYNPATGVLLAATHGRGMFSLTLDRALTLAVIPTARLDSTFVANPAVLEDSASVLLTGSGATATSWTAAHGAGTWLTLTAATGTGSGTVRWTRDPSGLTVGTYVDTVTVTVAGAIDSPALVVDTFMVLGFAIDPPTRQHSLRAGSITAEPDSADVTRVSDTTSWTATHGSATWLTITTASGTGSGKLRWTRDPTDLRVAVYVDTIAVTNSVGETALMIDTLLIEAPDVVPKCGAIQLFGKTCLNVVQQRYLDLEGNGDGSYNLGDFVALLRRLDGQQSRGRNP